MLVSVSERQFAAFAAKHEGQIPFDTSPRHLAGPGDARHVTHGLAAAGWSPTSDALSPEIVLQSTDRRIAVHLDPQSPTSAWWRVWAENTDSEAGWYAEFGELVPAEILSRFTDALIAPPPAQGADPFEVLVTAGWVLDSATAARSADGMCHVTKRHDPVDAQTSSWHIEVCTPGHGTPMGPRIWHAWFARNTPEHLVHTFIDALAGPAPLQRGMYDRTSHHSVVQEPSPLTPAQVVAAHVTRLNTIRKQASATRQRQRGAPATAAARASAAPPGARRSSR